MGTAVYLVSCHHLHLKMPRNKNKMVSLRLSDKRTRKVHRGGVKHRSQDRDGLPQRNVLMRVPIVSHVHKSLQMFPDEFDCWGKTELVYNFSGSPLQVLTFKVNGPFNLFGPQLQWTGVFGSNVPAGSQYLMSSNTSSGSNAPYQHSTIVGVECEVEWTSNVSASTPFCTSLIVPSVSPTLGGLATSAVREQRGASVLTLPAASTATPTPVPRRQVNRFTMADLFGVKNQEILQNPAFGQVTGVDPTQLAYVHILCVSGDGSTSVNYYGRITFNLHFRFRRINVLSSSVPTVFLSSPVAPTVLKPDVGGPTQTLAQQLASHCVPAYEAHHLINR